MKKLLVLLGCAVVLFSGCQNYSRSKNGVEVIIEGGGKFPQFLTGKWETSKDSWGNNWQITFKPDGVISSAVTPLTGEVRPNKTTRVQGRKGEPGFFEAGNFQVSYNFQLRELSARIRIKEVYMDMGSIAKGPCEYLIVGNISEDGKTWEADVFTSMDLHVLVPDPNNLSEGGKPKYTDIGPLSADFSDGPESLIFSKVSDEDATNSK